MADRDVAARSQAAKRPAIELLRGAEGWLRDNLQEAASAPASEFEEHIEARARWAEGRGVQPLWDGYSRLANYPRSSAATGRSSDQVRTARNLGRLYTALVARRRPRAIVEFGTAFGVSGMYWLAGLELAGAGHLYTFEPNAIWADIAQENLRSVSERFTLTRGIFEEKAAEVLAPGSVDIAFVDAIHTSEFVFAQYRVLGPLMAPGGLVFFDDIRFSDDMRSAWDTLAAAPEAVAAATLHGRVGVIELAS